MTLLLILFVVALVLFSTEWLPVEVTALFLLCALLLGKLLSVKEALAPFGSDTVLTLSCLFILTRALLKTGVIARIGMLLLGRSSNATRLIRAILTTVAGVSAFTSNTATTAVFLPIVLGLCKRSGIAASRVLMPLAYASILGGTITIIGTSTNLVVAGAMHTYHLKPLGFFELAWVGLPIAVLGLLYLFFVAPHLLSRVPTDTDLETTYNLRAYLSDLMVGADSPLVGQSLLASGLGHDYELSVVQVQRGNETWPSPGADFVLQAGDMLVIEGRSDSILSGKGNLGLISKPEQHLLAQSPDEDSGAPVLVEALVMPRSLLLGRTLKEARFREHYGMSVLALHRRTALRQALARTRIQVGDVLLIQGPPGKVAALGEQLSVLGEVEMPAPQGRGAVVTLVVFLGAIVLGALNVVPLVVALLSAVTLLLALRVLTPEEGYASVEWSILVLVACMLAFGQAFEQSGAAAHLTGLLAHWLTPLGPYGILAVLFVVTVVLTQPMSNQAAALVMLPLSVGLARELGYDPRPFVVGITVAASNSFITPLEPSCLLVYGPGRYRFGDFVRVGTGLTLITMLSALLIIPLVWPFKA